SSFAKHTEEKEVWINCNASSLILATENGIGGQGDKHSGEAEKDDAGPASVEESEAGEDGSYAATEIVEGEIHRGSSAFGGRSLLAEEEIDGGDDGEHAES